MFTSFQECKPIEILSGFVARFIHTQTQTFSWVEIKKGSVLPEHHHANEQVSHVIDGRFELTVDGKKKNCVAGDVAVIDANVPHSGIALTDCTILDIFTPVRQDYKELTVPPEERRE